MSDLSGVGVWLGDVWSEDGWVFDRVGSGLGVLVWEGGRLGLRGVGV